MYGWLIASIIALKKGLTGEIGERFEMGSDIGEKMGEKMGEERREGERETRIQLQVSSSVGVVVNIQRSQMRDPWAGEAGSGGKQLWAPC